MLFDEGAGGLEAGVQVQGADQRLQGVGQDRRIAPPAARRLAGRQGDEGRQVQLFRDGDQGLAAHQGGEAVAELALRLAGVAVIEHAGDGEAEHAVAEEFQAFVGIQARCLAGGMGQGQVEEAGIGEAVAQPLLKGGAGAAGSPFAAHSMPWKILSKRTVSSHFQGFQIDPPEEKNRNSARPTRFSRGIGPTSP